jgi:hypothetical protein
VQQNWIFPRPGSFGLCTGFHCWLPSSLLEAGFCWGWVWLKFVAAPRYVFSEAKPCYLIAQTVHAPEGLEWTPASKHPFRLSPQVWQQMATVMAIAWRLLGPSGVEQSENTASCRGSHLQRGLTPNRDGIYSRVTLRQFSRGGQRTAESRSWHESMIGCTRAFSSGGERYCWPWAFASLEGRP